MDRRVVVTPIIPKGPGVTFYLIDDTTIGRTGTGTSGGGWQIVDRPRRGASTEWLDHSPFTLPMTLMLDGLSDRPFHSPRSVEADVLRVQSWETRAAGKLEPPVLKVTGPVPRTDLQWVIQALQLGTTIRDLRTGHRLQQALSLTLLEYVPATLVTPHTSPAKSAQQRNDTSSTPTSSRTRYVVRAGDTLPSIAAAVYGNFRRWRDIAKVNAIIDPAAPLQVGRVLIIPAT